MKAFKIKRDSVVYYRVDLPKHLCPGGKRRSVMGKTRNEALAKAQEAIGQWERGLNRDAGQRTVAEFLKEFLPYYKRDGGIAPSTFYDYRYHVESHIVPALGAVKLQDLTPRHVDEFTRALAEKGLGKRSVRYALAVLRRSLQFAVDWKYIPGNPASSLMRAAKRRQPKELSTIRFFSADDARTFLKGVRGSRWEALYVLALTTGMRQGEMLGLQWSDVDFEAGKVTIFRALHRTKRRKDPDDASPWLEMRHPKTVGSRRSLEIPPITIAALRDHQEKQRVLRLLAGTAWQEQNLIFTTRKGTPVDTTNVLHDFQQTLERIGLPKMRFYDLRHTHASLLIAEGVHPKKIAERLGHASIRLTMDLYGHLFEGSDKESAARMERLFGGLAQNRDATSGNVVVLPAPESA